MAALFLWAGCAPTAVPPRAQAEAMDPSILQSQGAALYQRNCASCHLAGQGSSHFPALRDSAVVQGEPAPFIRVILHGRRGESEINGQKINGLMPAQPYLTDVEIASICSYVRKEFTGMNGAVQPAQVAAERNR